MNDFTYMGFLYDLKKADGLKLSLATDQELNEWEKLWQTTLPLAYREVFKAAGKGTATGLMRNEYGLQTMEEMQREVTSIIERNNLDIDRAQIFAFSCFPSLGVFAFYFLEDGENPPVYVYVEGEPTYKKRSESFVDFIKMEDWFIDMAQRHSFRD